MKPTIGIFVTTTLASLGAFCLTGCQKGDLSSSGTEPKVGIVDYDRIAIQIGWRDDINTKLKGLDDKLTNELKIAQGSYQSQLETEKNTLLKGGTTLTPEQNQLISQLANVMQQSLRQLQGQDEQAMQQYRVNLIRSYREALRPSIANLAEDRNFWVILEKGDNVSYFKNSADLSNDLVDMVKAHPPMVAEVPLPEIPAPMKIDVKLSTTQPSTTQPTTAPASGS